MMRVADVRGQVVVWLRVGGELRPEAFSDGSPPAAPLPVTGHELPALPETDLNVPVVHNGELLGAISVTMPKDEPLRPAGQQLVTDAASQAGLVLANARRRQSHASGQLNYDPTMRLARMGSCSVDYGFASPGGIGRGRPIWPMLRYMMPPSGDWIRQMSAHAHLGR
jgi:hypothetical protein